MKKYECVVLTREEIQTLDIVNLNICRMCCFFKQLKSSQQCTCAENLGHGCFAREKRRHYYKEIPDVSESSN